MAQQQTRPVVLARIPCLLDGNSGNPGGSENLKGIGRLVSGGRFVSQAFSFKLLAGVTLFLLVGAVMPAILNKKPASSESTQPDAAVAATSPALSSDVPAVLEPAARRPVVMVSATSQGVAPPVAVTPPLDETSKPQAAPTAELATSSTWPSVAPPGNQPLETNGPKSPSEADPAKAIRSAEYQATVPTDRKMN